jgi:hypothetical protein
MDLFYRQLAIYLSGDIETDAKTEKETYIDKQS